MIKNELIRRDIFSLTGVVHLLQWKSHLSDRNGNKIQLRNSMKRNRLKIGFIALFHILTNISVPENPKLIPWA